MNITELQTKLKKLNINVSAREICQIWNMDEASFSRKKKAGTEIKFKNIEQLENYLNISIEQNKKDKEAFYYSDVFGSCGGGAFVLSEKRERINIPLSCFAEPISKIHEYSVINAVGNSMTPFINDRDRLIVQHLKTGEQIKDNRVYVFCYNNEIFVKRLSKNVNQLIIESDNKNYDTIKLQKEEMNDIIIIGQIVGLMRDCR